MHPVWLQHVVDTGGVHRLCAISPGCECRSLFRPLRPTVCASRGERRMLGMDHEQRTSGGDSLLSEFRGWGQFDS